MVLKDKIELLDSYSQLDDFTMEQRLVIKKLSYDSNSFVRGLVASLMVNSVNEFGFEILSRLSKDKNVYVRIEAFDSFSVFADVRVIELLQNVINNEKNTLAKSYAIMSFGDVVSILQLCDKYTHYILNIKNVSKSKECILSCLYCLSVFGQNVVDEILFYLDDNNYRIRMSAIAILEEIVNSKNKGVILNKLVELLKYEKVRAVREKIKSFITKYN